MTGKLTLANVMFLSFLNDKLSVKYTWDRTDIPCDYEEYGFTMQFINKTVEDIYSKLDSGIHPDSIAIEYLNSRVIYKEDFHKISFKGIPLFVWS